MSARSGESAPLTPTAAVILGFLGEHGKSGYEIKAEVDRSTRFFWAASYGQIYPELKRLSELGLVKGADDPRGERPKTTWQITGAGRQALTEWLLEPPETLELRHEGLLKLFFADALPPERRAGAIRAIAAQHGAKLDQLRDVASAAVPAEGDPAWKMVLDFGIEFNTWVVDWCERKLDEIEGPGAGQGEADV